MVGRNTLAALNVPVEDRIEQLVLNLERRRWMPDDLGRRYVFVNLADFNLKVVEGDQTIYEDRVVVGRPYHRTPVFSHEMTYLVSQPLLARAAEHRPQRAAAEDQGGCRLSRGQQLHAASATGALARQRSIPYSVDWQSVAPQSFAYKIRQGPGDGNALGRLKFMFPNRFNIYLHDTPAKSLFARDPSAASAMAASGSMNPPELAEVVLASHPGWDLERINRTIDGGDRTVVSLPEPLPVHLSYQTAWVNKDGSVHFRSDIYDRDMVLAEALMGTRSGRTF